MRPVSTVTPSRPRRQPTMVCRSETFFGQDRIDVLKWWLRGLGIAEAAAS